MWIYRVITCHCSWFNTFSYCRCNRCPRLKQGQWSGETANSTIRAHIVQRMVSIQCNRPPCSERNTSTDTTLTLYGHCVNPESVKICVARQSAQRCMAAFWLFERWMTRAHNSKRSTTHPFQFASGAPPVAFCVVLLAASAPQLYKGVFAHIHAAIPRLLGRPRQLLIGSCTAARSASGWGGGLTPPFDATILPQNALSFSFT